MTPELDEGAGRSQTRGRARLLVVEDEARIAQFLFKGLTADGLDIVVAEDGDVGLFLATSDRFDAIVLDLTLPGLPGLEVLTRLRREQVTIPVIVLTGQDDPEARRSALSAGASAFVTKPLRFDELKAVLFEHLDRPRD